MLVCTWCQAESWVGQTEMDMIGSLHWQAQPENFIRDGTNFTVNANVNNSLCMGVCTSGRGAPRQRMCYSQWLGECLCTWMTIRNAFADWFSIQ